MSELRVDTASRSSGELPGGHYGLSHVIQMEWIRLRSLRSTWWITAFTVAAMISVAVLVLHHYSADWAHLSAGDRVSFDPTNRASYPGLLIAQLAVAVLGILAVTGEYSSGMIQSTLVAVPRRGLVLVAKAIVIGLFTLVIGEAAAFAAFLAGQSALRSPAPDAALSQPGVLLAVLMAAAYLPLMALISLAIGAIVRHAAAAIAVVVGLIFVLPLVTAALGGGQHSVQRFVPEVIAADSITAVRAASFALSPWTGLAILILYAVVALGLAGLMLARRDA